MERVTITMDSQDLATVFQVSKDFGLRTRSAGVRYIIRDWMRLRAEEHARRQRMEIIQAHCDGHITVAEKDAALRSLGFGGDGQEG